MRWIKVPDYFSGGGLHVDSAFVSSVPNQLGYRIAGHRWQVILGSGPRCACHRTEISLRAARWAEGHHPGGDDFIDRLVNNATLNKNKAIDAGRKASPPPYLKFQVSELVCEVTGGPCKYTGKNMKDAHAHLHITETEWKIMAADFKKSLDKFKVPQTEQKELFDIVGKTKADIVTVDDTEASEKKPKK